MDYVKLDYINKNDLLNKIELKKVKSNFSIKGKSFDATQFINNSMDDDESITIFENFNSKFDIKIDTTYINKNDYTKNLFGNFSFKKNKELIFKDISITEKNNQILIKDLLLSKNFKIKELDYVKLNYRNKNNLINKIELKRNKSNFSI